MGHQNSNIADILQKTATEHRQLEPDTPELQPNPKSERPPSRYGKTGFTTYFDEAAHTQLKILAIEQKTSMHEIMIKALNVYFELNNKPPIA